MSGPAARAADAEAGDRGRAWAGFIAARSGARCVEVKACHRLGGGAIQDNFALDVVLDGGSLRGEQSLVVRMDAPTAISASLDRASEFAVLEAAHEAGVTVPEPLFLCTDETLAGRAFYVMRRVAGSAAGHRLAKDDALDDDGRRALGFRLGQELARIHAIRPPHAGLAFLPLPETPPALERIARYRAWLDATGTPRPALEWGLAWLYEHAPPAVPLTLVHGDFRTGNYMVDDGRLTGVLDWEFSAWGDPMEDLGWFCARCWRFGAGHREAGGVAAREDLYAGYTAVSGQPVAAARVPYWEVMASVRWGVIALQQAGRHLSGEQSSLELALTGRMVAQMELDLLEYIERLQGAQAA